MELESLTYSKENHWRYKVIDVYKEVKNPDEWLKCPNCGIIPLIWEFDNGRSTACACGDSKYNHFSINAESIMSVHNRSNGSVLDYNFDELRLNWNHWVKTGEILFKGRNFKNRW